MSSSIFNRRSISESHPVGIDEWPFFTTVEETRKKFEAETKILIAIGGWGDEGFEEAAGTEGKRELWASNVARMVDHTGADGMLFSYLLCCVL